MTETELIQKIARQFPNRSKKLKVGIGDDCSVARGGEKELLFTCDALVEGVHFKKEWASWRQWGKKIAGAALSDIAAMGGTPLFAWLDLHLPKNFREKELFLFLGGLKSVLEKFGVTLAGGNMSRSLKGFSATVMLSGKRAKGTRMLRSSAKVGDGVYIAGPVGWARMGLKMLRQKVPGSLRGRGPEGAWHPFVSAFLNPRPQIRLGQWLAKNRLANACIDVSDGLLQDLNHIAQSSKVKIVIEANRIPFAGNLKSALTSGEDYILAFTVPPSNEKKLSKRRGIQKIGFVEKGKPGVVVRDPSRKPIQFARMGFGHF